MATSPDGEGGQTQQWPTELTGRGSSYWLSIHRSSPRVPDGRDRLSEENRNRNRNSSAEGSRCARWISAGNSTSTGTHIQLPHGVAVTPSVHQKAQNRHYLQVRGGHLQGGFGDLCHLERKKNKGKTDFNFKCRLGCSYIDLGRRSLVT